MVSTHLRLIYSVVLIISVFQCDTGVIAALGRKRRDVWAPLVTDGETDRRHRHDRARKAVKYLSFIELK